MSQSRVDGNLYVDGALGAKTFTPPASSIGDAAIAAGAGVQATKLIHANPTAVQAGQLFAPATTVVALTQTLGMAHAAGTLQAFGAWIEVQATGSDRTVSVDLQKSTGGGAYATVLSSPVAIDHTTTIRILVTATISSATYVAGDIFRLVVAVSGSASAQATGLGYKLATQEAAQ